MAEHERPGPEQEAIWRGILLGTDPRFRDNRFFHKRLPSSPRCKMCATPFGGPVGRFMRSIGRGPWPKNTKYCGQCFGLLQAQHGGAEIDCSILFADVRGSTGIAERTTAIAFRDLLNRFYGVATDILVRR
ncbi:MAG: adenylate/guanylate cyclase domain-containing protein, partial [Candidatus Limnocylindrales bacterium]